MAKTDFRNIDEYHAGFSGEKLLRLNNIRAQIKEMVPDAQEEISYQIPAFKYKKSI
ncbi:MAG: hypothetical protein J5I59_10660 [Saprospiraceae bacterium]|nr:hypothetical protein [Saprospiraceae bacterium]